MTDTADDAEEHDFSAFRSSKKRKIYRRRQGDQEDQDAPAVAAEMVSGSGREGEDHITAKPGSSVTDIIRQRRLQQRTRAGIEFTAGRVGDTPFDGPSSTTASTTPTVMDVASRFVGSQGYTASVDTHMIAYIDTELARRKAAGVTEEQSDNIMDASIPAYQAESRSAGDQSIASGALQEVDIAAAKTRDKLPKAQRIRLGPDGKPWRGGRRKRRTSEDVKRDALVESLMRESQLGLYEGNGSAPSNGQKHDSDAGADDDADERAAEEFKREFLEAASSRRDHNLAQQKAKGDAADDKLKGPKLGGSRSQRARMHAIEAEKEREKERQKELTRAKKKA